MELYILFGIMLLLLARGIWETHMLEITHTLLGEGKKSIKVLLISDIHAEFFFLSKRKLAQACNVKGLEAIFFAGDLTSGKRDISSGIKIFKSILDIAVSRSIPVFAVGGNHDVPNLDILLGELGVTYLSNSHFHITANDGSRWRISGLEDFRCGKPSMMQAITTDGNIEFAACDGDIVLAHNPDCFYDVEIVSHKVKIPPKNIFVLSGHFHGGQIWMPFNLEYKVMRHEKMCKEGYRKGKYIKNNIQGYITRGLGNVLIPLRFMSLPEASVIELRTNGN